MTRIPALGLRLFAATLIGLGILGLINGDFTVIWQPVPKGLPAREMFAYLSSLLFLATGIGLLWQRTAILAARVLFASLLLWLLLLRVPDVVRSFTVNYWWSASKTAVMVAAAWALYVGLATDWDRQRLGFAAGDLGLRIARGLYGLALIPFGIAHFMYPDPTTALVPQWLPGPSAFWAYFTGAAYIAAGAAVVAGVFAQLAAALSALQTGIITLLVWVPFAIAGQPTAFQWGEIVVSVALTTASWVIADSYWRAARDGDRGLHRTGQHGRGDGASPAAGRP